MTREQILQVLRATPNIGKVTHEEFADYVIAITQRRRGEEGWQNTEHPYMTVDGKLAMANQDHARQGKRLDFGPPQVLVDHEDQLTLMVTVTSEIYGTRHGIATSRRIGGAVAEREFPWEVAETSATGRALSMMGYGLFPGSGLASAEDMLRVGTDAQRGAERRGGEGERGSRQSLSQPRASLNEARPTYARSHPPLSPVQRNKLIELWRALHGGSELDATEGLDKLFAEAYKHDMSEATYEEGARLTGQLLSEIRNHSPQAER
ncbi:MAG: hypothetical protein L0Y55_14250 [Anaerolineales bacterium]|nr:hypothetical protein [Anaerolineales bacterium]